MSEDTTPATDETVAPDAENKSATPEVEKAAETPEVEAKNDTDPAAEKAESDDAKEDKPKPKSRAQERIEQLSREKRNAQRALAKANQEIGRLRATPPPQEEDYTDTAEYTRAQIRRAAKESAVESQFENVNQDFEALKQKRQEVWREVVAEARTVMPDFDNVFDNTVPVTELMGDLIAESDVAKELAYYLGKNRSVAHRIAEMTPIEAARELGRLEGRVSPPKAKSISSAPKPVSTVTGKAHAQGKTMEDMSYDEYRAARMAQLKAAGGR
jgi:hypothetical protein